MAAKNQESSFSEKVWRTYLTTGKVPKHVYHPWYESKYLRPLVRALPSNPRCRVCYYPFHGIGGILSRTLLGLTPSKLNPQLCNVCERFADRHQGGAELELSLLFADVRGSTRIAESMSPSEFSELIDRFYQVTTKILFRQNAFIEKLIGDEVTGFFVPGFAGEQHAMAAIEAGEEILRETGHEEAGGPWIPIGVGVHTGIAYVGTVSTGGGTTDIAVLGDNVNVGARIAAQAGIGDVLISDVAMKSSGLDHAKLETRHLDLRGRTEPIDVWVKSLN